MLLAIDIGNSRVKAALFDGERVAYRVTRETTSLRSETETLTLFQETCPLLRSGSPTSVRVALCSVVPNVSTCVASALARLRPRLAAEPIWIGHELDLGLKLGVREPERIGPDRLAAAVAAVESVGCPVIAMSCGTAIALTVVDSTRTLIGGAIAPGPEAGARGLRLQTSLLPEVTLRIDLAAPLPPAVGEDTESAIRSGLLYGLLGTTRELIARTHALLGQEVPVLLTGGYARFIGEALRAPARVEDDLILHGIRILAERNFRI